MTDLKTFTSMTLVAVITYINKYEYLWRASSCDEP